MNQVLLSLSFFVAFSGRAPAQHDHGGEAPQVKAPRIFLDKSPRVVAYQLNRLSTEQLLLVETRTDDEKYAPVFQAILTREGMSRAHREEALQGLVAVRGSNAVAELANVMASVSGDDAGARQTTRALAKMLLSQSQESLEAAADLFVELAQSKDGRLAPVAFGALLASGRTRQAWDTAEAQDRKHMLLDSIPLIPSVEVRSGLHAQTLQLTTRGPTQVRQAAVRALASIPAGQQQTFQAVAELVDEDHLRIAAIKTLLSVPAKLRDPEKSAQLIAWLVDFAERTPAAQRTENSFLDAMELVEQLLANAPTELAKTYRSRLRETVVRVVRIHTVEEEMRYDVPYFAVEAGRPVQLVLINEDLMPHNLVICQPGTLKEVAEEGAVAGSANGLDGKQYVPKSDNVLFATHMIAASAQERLTFDAPSEPGEYPYVCTFPRHWMRMYGVMVVVEDLDQWLKDPVEPTDPIGSNRQFVQSWTVEDFKQDLESGLRGRSPQIGERIFVEATCAQCHKAGAVGVGNVGPELSETFTKLKGNAEAVLQEILDPSHRIEDKYAVHLVLDLDGQTYSGLVVDEDKEKLSILENPEAKEPTVILKDDIEQRVKTANSMMPKGLMDRFSRDEIFELLGFLKSVQKQP